MRDLLIASIIVAVIVAIYFAWKRRYTLLSRIHGNAPIVRQESSSTNPEAIRFATETLAVYNNYWASQSISGAQRRDTPEDWWRLSCAAVKARWDALRWTIPAGACDPRLVGVVLRRWRAGDDIWIAPRV